MIGQVRNVLLHHQKVSHCYQLFVFCVGLPKKQKRILKALKKQHLEKKAKESGFIQPGATGNFQVPECSSYMLSYTAYLWQAATGVLKAPVTRHITCTEATSRKGGGLDVCAWVGGGGAHKHISLPTSAFFLFSLFLLTLERGMVLGSPGFIGVT